MRVRGQTPSTLASHSEIACLRVTTCIYGPVGSLYRSGLVVTLCTLSFSLSISAQHHSWLAILTVRVSGCLSHRHGTQNFLEGSPPILCRHREPQNGHTTTYPPMTSTYRTPYASTYWLPSRIVHKAGIPQHHVVKPHITHSIIQ